ncbi:hypothetical protein [Aeromonas hydrophila]|uniref:hypothetical protein n=1 Tax=Aeromonas hydrophila TaxID=644 RepID=UPI002B0572CF|nr:hypothetical protein [Aeromonas hydrophila]
MQSNNLKNELVRQAEDALTAYTLVQSQQAVEMMRHIVGKWLDTITPAGDPAVREFFNKLREQSVDKQMAPEEMRLFLVGVLVAS